MELALVRTPDGFRPADRATVDAVRAIPLGSWSEVTIKQPRNLRQHRLFFALLNAIAEATGRWPSGGALLIALKMEAGHVDLIQRLDGSVERHPRSIAFSAMDQDEFAAFFRPAIDLLEEHVIPDVRSHPLAQQIYDMIDGRKAA